MNNHCLSNSHFKLCVMFTHRNYTTRPTSSPATLFQACSTTGTVVCHSENSKLGMSLGDEISALRNLRLDLAYQTSFCAIFARITPAALLTSHVTESNDRVAGREAVNAAKDRCWQESLFERSHQHLPASGRRMKVPAVEWEHFLGLLSSLGSKESYLVPLSWCCFRPESAGGTAAACCRKGLGCMKGRVED